MGLVSALISTATLAVTGRKPSNTNTQPTSTPQYQYQHHQQQPQYQHPAGQYSNINPLNAPCTHGYLHRDCPHNHCGMSRRDRRENRRDRKAERKAERRADRRADRADRAARRGHGCCAQPVVAAAPPVAQPVQYGPDTYQYQPPQQQHYQPQYQPEPYSQQYPPQPEYQYQRDLQTRSSMESRDDGPSSRRDPSPPPYQTSPPEYQASSSEKKGSRV